MTAIRSDEPTALLPELSQALTATEEEVACFFGALAPAEFARSLGESWSPAEHLDHLNIAVSATARGFGLPRFIARLRFGRAVRPSRTFGQLKADYLTLLASGGRATGAFVPRRAEAAQAALIARWRRVNARLLDAVLPWPERDLDCLRFPHPLLGRITGRELIMFTIYHGQHHVVAVQRRLAQPTVD
jgi:hypothetical protein